MDWLELIGLIILGIIIAAGIVRSIFSPTRGVLSFIIEMLWLDMLIDALFWVISAIADVFD